MRVLGVVLLGSATLFGHVLHAQSMSAWLDAGGASVRQPRSAVRSAGTVGGGLGIGRRTWSLLAEGALSTATDSVNAAQFVASAGFSPSRARWSLTTVEASTTTVGIAWPRGDGNRSALVRQQVSVPFVQVFAGFGAARTARMKLKSRGDVVIAGAQSSRGPLFASLTVQRSHTDDYQLIEASGLALVAPAPWYELRDTRVDVAWQVKRFGVAASRTWRSGYGNTRGRSDGRMVTGSWQPLASWQLIAYAGTQIADPLRGVPEADVTGAALRWTAGGARTSASRDARYAVDRLPTNRVVANAEYSLERDATQSLLVIRVAAAQDAKVEVASSFGEWKAEQAMRDGNTFVARLALPTGTHRVAIRINGGEWRAPRGLVRVADDFGGNAGLVVIP